MWQWLEAHSGAIGVLIAAIPIAWAVVQFIFAKRREAKRLRFETYHSLIKQLVQPEETQSFMYLDRQVAVVYELRDFKHYFPVTLRILAGLKQTWSSSALNSSGGLQRLLKEMELTISYIQAKV